MKKTFAALMLMSSTLFVACKKDKDGPSTGLSFKVDGTVVNTASAKGVLIKETGVAMLTVTGTVEGNTAAWGVTVYFPNGELKTGTYTAADDAVLIYSGAVGANGMTSIGEGGNISIAVTKIDDHNAAGTFSGKVVNMANPSQTKTITDGQFNVSF